MSPENQLAYGSMVQRCNALTQAEVDALIALDACPYEPEWLVGVPLGMFHCPLCGDMVLAGVPHVRRAEMEELADVTPTSNPTT